MVNKIFLLHLISLVLFIEERQDAVYLCEIVVHTIFTAQCTLVHLRGLAIACRLSVCNVGDL